VGIPGTIAAGSLVSVAIAGLLLVLAIGPWSEAAASFLVGGIDVVLAALIRVVEWFAAPTWAAVMVGRSWVLAGLIGWAAVALVLSRATGLGRGTRHVVMAGGAAFAIVLAPPLRAVADRGTLAIEMLDVGQGDAVLIRSPAGRWILVDAGPRSDGWDAGERVVVPALRRRGVRRLEALVLTHPHLDHGGGAAAVLRALDVGVVIDPGRPFGTAGFVDALEAAEAAGAPWVATTRGALLRLDGITLEVLHPTGLPVPPDVDPNDVSVVLLVRYGAFGALLTGDAPRAVEEALPATVGSVQVLKVGHHGSETSSSGALLAALRPAVALVSAGRGNRFGHPHPSAVARLEAAGASVRRTDLEGDLTVRGREDGSWTLSAERAPD
jgi:competence protein ComEC